MGVLDTLPPELLIDIFSSACTDSGRTGCHLSLVCKSFRELCITTGVDIQCVLVCGVQHMDSFLKMLEGRDNSSRKVQSLMLADQAHDEDQAPLSSRIKRILQSVSPDHLQILAIYLPSPSPRFHVSTIVPVYLPELVELIVSGPFGLESFAQSCTAPKLTRLHIAGFAHLPQRVGTHLARMAPNLTHLKISNVDVDAGNDLEKLLDFLHAFSDRQASHPFPAANDIATDSESDHNADQVILGPPLLKKVVIKFKPYFQEWRCGTGAWSYKADIRRNFKPFAAPLPEEKSEIEFDRPLIVLPVPGAYSYCPEGFKSFERDGFEAFKTYWEGCSSLGTGTDDVSWVCGGS